MTENELESLSDLASETEESLKIARLLHEHFASKRKETLNFGEVHPFLPEVYED